jgi:glycosyltransferase involved in cell wall biosynthesis
VKSLVLVTHEAIAPTMAGPSIRVYEMARALADTVRPIIASPYPITRDLPPGVSAAVYRFGDDQSLARIVQGADALLVQGFTLQKFPFLADLEIPIVVDFFCPFQLENLERLRHTGAPVREMEAVTRFDLAALIGQVRRGDFFICANERQRDLWLGMLTAYGRLTPEIYAEDPEARNLIAVVAFGISSVLPERTGPGFKGTIPGISPGDRLIVWGGSVLEWQDPVTVVEAVAMVADSVPTVRLALPAGTHPNPEIPAMPVLERARARARELGIADTHLFLAPWVLYDHRANYLLEADIGVSTHRRTLETRYAWRTRMLDYIWARLPIACTTGDPFAELVASRRLGLAVPPEDPQALAGALLRLLQDADLARTCRENLAVLGDELLWTKVVEPIRRFMREPKRRRALPVEPGAAPVARRSWARRQAGWMLRAAGLRR